MVRGRKTKPTNLAKPYVCGWTRSLKEKESENLALKLIDLTFSKLPSQVF